MSLMRSLRSSVLSLSLSLALAPLAAHADPVTIPAAGMQLTPLPGWTGQSLGPQVAQFRRGELVTVDVMMPALDATHTEASLVAELTRVVNPTWDGPAVPRVLREQRGTLRRGTVTHNGRRERVIIVSVPQGARLLLAAIYVAPSATREEEGSAHQLLDTLQPVP